MCVRLIITVITSLVVPVLGRREWPPHSWPREWKEENWDQLQMAHHFRNLTRDLVRDATNKLHHADKVKEEHSKSITFELGTIAAGMMERYQKMLKLYKKGADLTPFRERETSVEDLYESYEKIRGYYHEIRLEQKLFYEIKKRHESTRATPRVTVPQRTYKRFTPPGLRAQRKWAPNGRSV